MAHLALTVCGQILNMAILEQLVIYHIKHICVGANLKQGEIPCKNMNNEQT